MKRTQGRELLLAMKRSARAEGPTVGIAVGTPIVGVLRPIAASSDDIASSDVTTLTVARNRYVHSFLTEFEATDNQTRNWLINTVGPNDSKLLFMCDDATGKPIGYMGLDYIDWHRGTGEADSVVRSAASTPGFMTLSLRTLMRWAETQLGLDQLSVRVRSDNPALGFYENAGFVEYQRVPLVRLVEPGLVRWTESESAASSGVTLVYLRWRGASDGD